MNVQELAAPIQYISNLSCFFCHDLGWVGGGLLLFVCEGVLFVWGFLLLVCGVGFFFFPSWGFSLIYCILVLAPFYKKRQKPDKSMTGTDEKDWLKNSE